MDFYDIRNIEIVRRIITDIESEQNRQRKKEDFDSYQIMSGNQRQYVSAALKSLYPQSHKVMVPSNINLTQKVVDRIGCVYKDAPTRKVNGKDNENLSTIYKESSFDYAYATLDKTFNRSRCALAWVQNDYFEKTKFKLVTLPQYSFDVVIDNDTLELKMVILSYPDTTITTGNRQTRSDSQNQIIAESQLDSSSNGKRYAIWTDNYHVTVRAYSHDKTTVIDYIHDESNPDGINYLGKIPFVWVTTQPDVPEYPVPNPLAQEAVNINVMNSSLLSAAVRQYGVLVLKYPQGSPIRELHSGHSVAMQLPQKTDQDPHIETTAEYIVPNSDLTGMRETFLEYAAGVLSDNGLEGATLSGETKNFSSGLERLIASASIMDKRSQNIDVYRKVETQVFELIKAYDKVNGTRLFGDSDELTVQYAEPRAIVSEKEKLEVIQMKDDLGLLEEEDKFKEAFNSMSPRDIKKKIKRINEQKKQAIEAMGLDFGNQESNEE